jgi:hypothetical protein
VTAPMRQLAGLLIVDDAACRAVAAALFPGVPPTPLPAADFVPPAPFEGPLFALLEGWATGREAGGEGPQTGAEHAGAPANLVGLVVPAVWHGELAGKGAPEALGAPAAPGALPHGILVADHVNLVGSGPLTGRWPAGRARSFPSLTGVYQPSQVRPPDDGRVYSALALAGVADAERLSPFERRQMQRCGLAAASSRLVPPVVIAAYYGLAVAAAAAPRLAGPPTGREGPH